jgi:hypothetical protein
VNETSVAGSDSLAVSWRFPGNDDAFPVLPIAGRCRGAALYRRLCLPADGEYPEPHGCRHRAGIPPRVDPAGLGGEALELWVGVDDENYGGTMRPLLGRRAEP